MEFKDYSCQEFVKAVGSDAPAPGGGGAAALCAAIGAALGNMVGAFTVGKEKYTDVEEQIKGYMTKCDEIQAELLRLADEDAVAFIPVSEAYKLPTDTEEQRAYKEETLEKALYGACEVPVSIMRKCAEAMDIIEKLSEIGSKMLVSDAGCAMSICRGALEACSLNIYVNTKLMKDRSEASNYNGIANELLYVYTTKADRVFAKVKEELRYVDPNKKQTEMPDFDAIFANIEGSYDLTSFDPEDLLEEK